MAGGVISSDQLIRTTSRYESYEFKIKIMFQVERQQKVAGLTLKLKIASKNNLSEHLQGHNVSLLTF